MANVQDQGEEDEEGLYFILLQVVLSMQMFQGEQQEYIIDLPLTLMVIGFLLTISQA